MIRNNKKQQKQQQTPSQQQGSSAAREADPSSTVLHRLGGAVILVVSGRAGVLCWAWPDAAETLFRVPQVPEAGACHGFQRASGGAQYRMTAAERLPGFQTSRRSGRGEVLRTSTLKKRASISQTFWWTAGARADVLRRHGLFPPKRCLAAVGLEMEPKRHMVLHQEEQRFARLIRNPTAELVVRRANALAGAGEAR